MISTFEMRILLLMLSLHRACFTDHIFCFCWPFCVSSMNLSSMNHNHFSLCSQPNSMKLHTLISKLKKWIKILEAKAKLLPSSFLLEETCRFISNFSQSTAEVELPGEFLMPRTTTVFCGIFPHTCYKNSEDRKQIFKHMFA